MLWTKIDTRFSPAVQRSEGSLCSESWMGFFLFTEHKSTANISSDVQFKTNLPHQSYINLWCHKGSFPWHGTSPSNLTKSYADDFTCRIVLSTTNKLKFMSEISWTEIMIKQKLMAKMKGIGYFPRYLLLSHTWENHLWVQYKVPNTTLTLPDGAIWFETIS